MPARSIRWPRAFCRSPSARRRRPCPSCRMARRPIASPCAGAPRPTPTTPTARSSARATRGPSRPRSPRCCPGSTGTFCRRRRHFRRSRSPASAPMISRATASMSNCSRAPSRSTGSKFGVRRRRDQLVMDCGKGTYVRAIARDLGRVLGCFGHVTALRRTRVGPFVEQDGFTFEEIEARAAPPRRCNRSKRG